MTIVERWKRFMRGDRKCSLCGKVKPKSDMVNPSTFTWFCSEEKADQYQVRIAW